MAAEEHLEILRQGVEVWNKWRADNPDIDQPDLREAPLRQANLSGVDFRGVQLFYADLRMADLRQANLCGAEIRGAYLFGANFEEADLEGANLMGAGLVYANLTKANLSNCRVFGISAWKVQLEGAKQSNLIISDLDEPTITVDNLEVAQFIYLLLSNEGIRNAIDTITSKVVLILGRFTPERKVALDAIRNELRTHNYLPILFDFEKPSSRDLTETVSTLAHLARFIFADVTDAKSIPQELQRIIPDLPSVPVQPIIASSDYEYAMFEHFRHYPWVLDEYQYDDVDDLLSALAEKIIAQL